MQISSQRDNQKYLIAAISSTFVIWFVSYLMGPNASTITTDFAYIPLSLFVLMVAVYQLFQARRKQGEFRIWIFFLIYAISIVLAEHIWSLNELILDIKPFPSMADAGYVTAYIFLPVFLILLVKQFKKSISKKMILGGILVGVGSTIPAIYYALLGGLQPTVLENVLLVLYPILDGVSIAPAFVGMLLLAKKKISFSSSLIFFAVIPELVGDFLFQVNTQTGTYYSGSLADFFYFITYILFIFGVYGYSKSREFEELEEIN